MTDSQYKNILIKVMEKRENTFSKDVNIPAVDDIFQLIIKPILVLGTIPTLSGDDEKEKFVLELFALACFSKDNTINEWEYNPVLTGSNLTPDFLLNKSQYLEVYSPVSDLPRNMLATIKQQEIEGSSIPSTGFQPVSTFWHSVAKPYLENKSVKYKNYKITFLVHTIAGGFSVDMINTLKQIQLSSPDHQLVYYKGNKKEYAQ